MREIRREWELFTYLEFPCGPSGGGGGLFDSGRKYRETLKKRSEKLKKIMVKEVFLSLKYEESIENSYGALRALLHVEMMLQRYHTNNATWPMVIRGL